MGPCTLTVLTRREAPGFPLFVQRTVRDALTPNDVLSHLR